MFRADVGGEEHFAVLVGGKVPEKVPLVRLHSQCITGDVLGSLKCDCGDQLKAALSFMANNGGGVRVYLAPKVTLCSMDTWLPTTAVSPTTKPVA